ncbi:unnamed protein product [Calicophoron daubneyi]|uniref:Palmitoyl-protein thioesterase 1 n=1 Tax=Calicophoron daubneyi TaxID=300641 RepID=A0AAV2TEV4_CALDB
MKSALILLNFCVLLGQVKLESLPVIIWHGMGDHGSGEGIQNLARAIEQVFPRVYVKCIITGNTTIQDLEDSYFKPIDQQLKEVCQMLQNDSRFSGGLHMIGISQGGLFVRALAQRCPLKNIGSVVSIGGPQLGVYGLPKCRDFYYIHLCWMMSKLLSYGAYTDFVQEHLVQAQYWHDPLREETYRKKCRFLTDINQENVSYEKLRHTLP